MATEVGAFVAGGWMGVLLVLGCGGPPPPVEGPPPTDRDPVAYAPPPILRGTTGEPVAVVVAGGEDQARALVPRFLEAMRDALTADLSVLLAPSVTLLGPGRRGRHERAPVVLRLVRGAQRLRLPPDLDVGELVDLAGLRVGRAAYYWDGRLPGELRPTDLVVEVPIRDAGRQPLRRLLGWGDRGTLVVRPGPNARIVGL